MTYITGTWGVQAKRRSATRREYFKSHYLLQKEKYNQNSRKGLNNLRTQIFDLLGFICTNCGFDDIRALQIDHVNGNGRQEILKLKSTYTYYKKILDDKLGNYQILCANCNWIKRSERNEVRT